MSRDGADLAMLLLGGFRSMVDVVQDELEDRGFEDVRPVHDFAIRAIAAGAESASELGRQMAVSKQAAAKTIDVLLDRGYVERDTDPRDKRRKRLQVTDRGHEMLAVAESIFDGVRQQWVEEIGSTQLQDLESYLRTIAGHRPARLDTPSWLARDLGDPP